MALSRVTGSNNVLVIWIYNGRDTIEAMQSVGLLFNSLPVALILNDKITLGDVSTQIYKTIQNRAYIFNPSNLEMSNFPDDMIYVIYQEGIKNYETGSILKMKEEKLARSYAVDPTTFNIEILDEEEGQRVFLNYSASRYKPETIENFGKIFASMVKAITYEANGLETNLMKE